MKPTPLRILHVSSEVAPFSKSGGLADVSSSLPLALSELGHEVVVVSPRYGTLRDCAERKGAAEFELELNAHKYLARFPEHSHDRANLRFVFVDVAELFGRAGYYNDPKLKQDYDDNDARFALLSLAALAWCKHTNWRPDIVHAHDWQTGPLPIFLRSPRFSDFFAESRLALTIHNIAFQGNFHAGSRVWLDHSDAHFYPGGKVEFHGQVNYLKIAIEFADAINTVSPTYAHELRTVEHMGFGLGPLLQSRHKHFAGILNGIDTHVWNPHIDPLLPVQFAPTTLALRNKNKRKLCEQLALPYDQALPVIGMVTRVSEQKGFSILIPVIGEIISGPAQFVILGNGDPVYENRLLELQAAYPQRVRVISEYNEPLAHLIYGGADMFLMPSQFEPCGLSQMMALRYGCPPIARETGGLADTISDADHDRIGGTGFLFREYDQRALAVSVKRAISNFRKTDRWRVIQRHGMKQDFSWKRSARVYEEMYRRMLAHPRQVS
ncbi:MAG: glycogen synthase GlgA [bacterium]|nr:glycogen synthase GlgA [bacterium]